MANELQTQHNSANSLLDVGMSYVHRDERIPPEIKKQILNIPKDKSFYGGFLSMNEDLAEKVHTIQSYIQDGFKKRDDGRYEWQSLLLDEDETPEDFLREQYPNRNLSKKDPFGFGTPR